MIDAIIVMIAAVAIPTSSGDEHKTSADIICISAIGVAVYAFCAQFLSLTLPFWCVFISPVWFIIALFVPGGFTITNIILNAVGVMGVPIWVFIIGVIADVLIIGLMIWSLITSVRNKQ